MFNNLAKAFKTLAVPRDHDSKYLSLYSITEQSLITNFEKLFLYPCDILARVLYIKLSDRKDHAKINFV